jgi:hypothetical protein
MTLDEIAEAIPNGFHDAKIGKLTHDFNSKTIAIDLQLWIGDLSSQEKPEREMRRRARLAQEPGPPGLQEELSVSRPIPSCPR